MLTNKKQTKDKKLSSRKSRQEELDQMEEPSNYVNEIAYPNPNIWKPINFDHNEDVSKESDNETKKQTKEVAHYIGHRKRLKERFVNTNGEGITDYELLELILFRSIVRSDVKPLAKKLLEQFGDLLNIFSATPKELLSIKGCGPATVLDFHILRKLCEKLTLVHVETHKTIFETWESLVTHCRIKLMHEKREIFYVLYLNKQNGLIKSEVQQIGTIDHSAIYPREIIKRALELGACSLVLVHNHPSGNPTPSPADIDITYKIISAGSPFDIKVHDHLIIGALEYSSLKQSGFI